MAKTTKAKTGTTKKVTKRIASTKRRSASASQSNFMDTKITEQTLYWFIFGAVAIIFALWLFTLDSKVRDLYDQIDTQTVQSINS